MDNSRNSSRPLRVIELFAGVGGFRVGLDRASKEYARGFETVWANQWEPSTGKNQHAAWTYRHAFFHKNGITDEKSIDERFSNEDINELVNDPRKLARIPDHDVLTGGFPCQDYSVARPLSQAKGIDGKKGVLWWSIQKILEHKIDKGAPVSYVFLENVDRLLKSPASKRGRDFAIILACLNNLGYMVEWRVVNAGEFGFPQRRKRTFILAYHPETVVRRQYDAVSDMQKWVMEHGAFAKAFPATFDQSLASSFVIDKDPFRITKDFRQHEVVGNIDMSSPFQNAGMLVDGRVFTVKYTATAPAQRKTLGDVVKATKRSEIDASFFVPKNERKRWKEQKGSHSFERTSKDGHVYRYTEGAMAFPDFLDRPSRTIITSEGGRTPTRFKHVICTTHGPRQRAACTGTGECELRRLTPEELEALCMFERRHTEYMSVPGKAVPVRVPDTKRAFFMGNALVVGAITQIGAEILAREATTSRAPRRVAARSAARPAKVAA